MSEAISTGIGSTVWGVSHSGPRDKHEDEFLILSLGDAYLLAVADGLGGHEKGELASKIAVKTLRRTFEENYETGMEDEDVGELLRGAYWEIHREILDLSSEPGKVGTTLTSAFVRNGKAVIANTGDSRAYLIRDGQVLERTRDHSIVEELLERGVIGPEEVRSHPMRHVVTRALGIGFEVDVYTWRLEKGDVLLLCSDGLHDFLDEGEIGEIAESGGPRDIAERLVAEALGVTEDNVTVVVFMEV